MNSILAGILIAIGAIAYLSAGGVAGAFLFSIGLIAVLAYEANLFTGKVGLLASREITWMELVPIWMGNFFGAWIAAIGMRIAKPELVPIAREIVEVRLENGFMANLVLGIFCGLLVYIAVNARSWAITVLAVAAFVAAGFEHCVADAFYLNLGTADAFDLWPLVPVSLGNAVGANIIPCIQQFRPYR